jgi:hypothetical protein
VKQQIELEEMRSWRRLSPFRHVKDWLAAFELHSLCKVNVSIQKAQPGARSASYSVQDTFGKPEMA